MATTVDRTFAALGDPTRIEIVMHLSRGAATVSELAAPFSMSLRAVLKHIETLEDAGLVRTVKTGRVRRCELERQCLDEVARFVEQVQKRWERRIDRLESYLQQQERS
jgi:DNA-binding transcriptional ArsR family regulator